jgi:hypothetical protein
MPLLHAVLLIKTYTLVVTPMWSQTRPTVIPNRPPLMNRPRRTYSLHYLQCGISPLMMATHVSAAVGTPMPDFPSTSGPGRASHRHLGHLGFMLLRSRHTTLIRCHIRHDQHCARWSQRHRVQCHHTPSLILAPFPYARRPRNCTALAVLGKSRPSALYIVGLGHSVTSDPGQMARLRFLVF